MIAVSDTTPLRHLIAIGQEDLLGRIFDKVVAPSSVVDELSDPKAPERVRLRLAALPAWLEVREVSPGAPVVFAIRLHRGERDAIILAEQLPGAALLIDERAGRSVALSRGIPLSGTLGILERADKIGLLADFPQTLRELKASGFFLSPSLEQLLLRRLRDRHRNP